MSILNLKPNTELLAYKYSKDNFSERLTRCRSEQQDCNGIIIIVNNNSEPEGEKSERSSHQ